MNATELNTDDIKQIKKGQKYSYKERMIIRKYNPSGVTLQKKIENIIKLKVQKSYL